MCALHDQEVRREAARPKVSPVEAVLFLGGDTLPPLLQLLTCSDRLPPRCDVFKEVRAMHHQLRMIWRDGSRGAKRERLRERLQALALPAIDQNYSLAPPQNLFS